MLRIIPQDRTIFNGNEHIGYIDENDDVWVFAVQAGAISAHKLGNADRFADALEMVRQWLKS